MLKLFSFIMEYEFLKEISPTILPEFRFVLQDSTWVISLKYGSFHQLNICLYKFFADDFQEKRFHLYLLLNQVQA